MYKIYKTYWQETKNLKMSLKKNKMTKLKLKAHHWLSNQLYPIRNKIKSQLLKRWQEYSKLIVKMIYGMNCIRASLTRKIWQKRINKEWSEEKREGLKRDRNLERRGLQESKLILRSGLNIDKERIFQCEQRRLIDIMTTLIESMNKDLLKNRFS